MDESTKRGLLAAYGRLLRPLIRILIRNEVTYGEFAEVAKETFVRVALEKAESLGHEDLSSTLTSITGMTGAEVKEIQEKISAAEDITNNLFDEIVNLLTSWHTKSEYTGPYGLPLELPFQAAGKMDFVTLAKACSPESDPQEILKELIETKAVKETKPGWFKAQTRHYIPEGSAPGGIEHLARNIEDIANTMDHNHSEANQKRRMFERNVYTEEGIRQEDLPRFAEFAGKKAQKFLEEVDNWITNLEAPDKTDDQRISTGFGIYHYIHREAKRK